MYARMNYRTVFFGISVLFALVFIMPVFMFNKPLIWDDWIWIHNSPDQLRDVANQLGLWWLADLNVFIYSLKNPNLFLATVAFSSHFLSIVVLSRTFTKLKILNDFQCGIWSACCMLSPFLTIRYINSVAFYNLYFMCFVCAAYIYVFHENKLSKLLAGCLFIFSFSLSSLIPAYFLIIFFSNRKFNNDLSVSLKLISPKVSDRFSNLYNLMWLRIKKIWIFACLPFLFFIIKYLSPYEKIKENPYDTYNLPQFDAILWSPLFTLKKTIQAPFEIFYYVFFGTNSLVTVMALATTGIVLTFIFWIKKKESVNVSDESCKKFDKRGLKSLIFLFLISYVLILPYILVGKPPILTSFTESRHYIVVQPFIFAIVIILISSFGYYLGRLKPLLKSISLILLVLIASFSAWRAVFLASTVWWDSKVSNQIIHVLSGDNSKLRFWIFDNQTPQFMNATPWNYVYTGLLISAFGAKNNFGISSGEYLEWKQPVKLLYDPYFRSRYNIQDYKLQDSYNYVLIKPLKSVSADSLVPMYIAEMFGYKHFDMNKIISVDISNTFGCFDDYVAAFVFGELKNVSKPSTENLYCRLEMVKHCSFIKKGSQTINLNPMELAYARQKYPFKVSAGTLRVIDANSDLNQIAKICSSLYEGPLEGFRSLGQKE